MMAFLMSTSGKYVVAGIVVAALLGGLYLKGRSDGEALIEGKVAAATAAAEKRAEALSNELIINQAIAMGATARKANDNVQKVHAATNDADRMRAGSVGVRSLIRGDAAPAK